MDLNHQLIPVKGIRLIGVQGHESLNKIWKDVFRALPLS